MLFYDFEVFKEDWLVVIMDMINQKEVIIVNDEQKLESFHAENRNQIWVGYNNNHYDQYIMKAILCGFDPKRVNDYIIEKGNLGWKFSGLFRKIQMYNYDVMNYGDGGLKTLEGFMGHDIRESNVPFDIERKLTNEEIENTIKYCRHDVQETIEVFIQRKNEFDAHVGLTKLVTGDEPMDLNLMSRTNAQLSAIILEARKQKRNDEFDIDFPDTLEITKYKHVVEWYANPENHDYKKKLETMIAGVPHVFGWGGIHGAIPKYDEKGDFLLLDVEAMYPSLMIEYNLLSRNVANPAKFQIIYNKSSELKAAGKKAEREPYKLVQNTTYGAMKAKFNALYDPRQANRVCIYGQLLLLDLIEKLEPHVDIIQSNTDGVLLKLRKPSDYELVDDIAYEWERRTGLNLEFEEYTRVTQKDVNNYVFTPAGELYDKDGKPRWAAKGAWVKHLNPLDNDLPIVNKALVEYMIHDVPVETTIGTCNDLKEFQLIAKIGGKFTHLEHGEEPLEEKTVRVFASNNENDGGLFKIHAKTGRPQKFQNSPLQCFIYNDDVNDKKVPKRLLDKGWYIEMANKRLKDFGVA